ncbi:hypothetical protein Gbem_4139 [Citrifermentans bemidjiense Bem]|uniref:Uncharacterized protein n=1 Tax=Citrifermentans bemidjiense (strain ATCC BAA-1014 / DSM 16622 / JCM 12645 / Bem) TaxID=404380 RepID=E1P6E4_CITBB|nr:hypothetical protein Gbem_4139 [Citrifermentans bemidjiense Bem]
MKKRASKTRIPEGAMASILAQVRRVRLAATSPRSLGVAQGPPSENRVPIRGTDD